MGTKRLSTMVYEIFKTLSNLNPVFMKDIFHYSSNVTRKKHNLHTSILKIQQSLEIRVKGFWCKHVKHITWIMFYACSMPKSTTSLLKFKKIIKTWPGPKHKCSVCEWEWNYLLNMIFIMQNILQRWIQGAVRHLRWSFCENS